MSTIRSYACAIFLYPIRLGIFSVSPQIQPGIVTNSITQIIVWAYFRARITIHQGLHGR
jgi:hypothetical protein